VRLFAAIDPPAADVDALQRFVDRDDPRLRWVSPEQWHVTLAFFGEVDAVRADDVSERLARAAARSAPFRLRLAGSGTFPAQSRRARMLWVGIDGDVEALTRLAERCVAAGRRAGITMEKRPFRPHLTLARTRRDPVDLTDRVEALRSWTGGDWPVTGFRLVHSTLGAQVKHETAASWRLGGHQA
jgi:2'-5' RNA ligase